MPTLNMNSSLNAEYERRLGPYFSNFKCEKFEIYSSVG